METDLERLSTPLGELVAIATAAGISQLTYSDCWLHPSIAPDSSPPARSALTRHHLQQLQQELAAYFAGQLYSFSVPLAIAGTPFQRQVWAELQRIPYGTTLSYSALAQHLGRPTAVRAVASANARNPLIILIPCHRVVAQGGQLGGYSGGLERKRWLLAREQEAGSGNRTRTISLEG